MNINYRRKYFCPECFKAQKGPGVCCSEKMINIGTKPRGKIITSIDNFIVLESKDYAWYMH